MSVHLLGCGVFIEWEDNEGVIPAPQRDPNVKHMSSTNPSNHNNGWQTALIILAPTAAGLLPAFAGIKLLESYGFMIFLGVPLVSSLLSGYLSNRRSKRTFGDSYGLSLLSILIIGIVGILIALDGLLCMLMALPLASLIALIGVAIGRMVALKSQGKKVTDRTAILLVFLFPFLVAAEKNFQGEPPVHAVTTSIEIAAPISVVWQNVIAFPPIKGSPELMFRLGIAYPIKARIEGHGIGAIRYCEFSTGPFVEPITVWDEPHLLSFDVKESPAPLYELSPYSSLKVAHLHGFMQSKRGQFRLFERGGKTVVEGTTWYSHSIAPDFYWHRISDYLIHRIHLRVLTHIKHSAEG